MPPHRGKDVMQLNVNRREGQETRNDHLEESATVPWHFGGNFTCHLRRTGGRIKVMISIILGHNTSQDGQWECN